MRCSSARISAWRGASKRRQGENAPHSRAAIWAVQRVEPDDEIGDQPIARAVRGVKVKLVAGKAADQRAHAVRRGDVEIRMLQQYLHLRRRRGQGGHRLHCEPLVQHQRVVAPPCVERRKREPAFRAIDAAQHAEGGEHVGHVARRLELAQRKPCALGRHAGGEVAEAGVAQRPAAHGSAVDVVGAMIGQPLIGGPQRILQRHPDRRAGGLPRRMDRLGIDDLHLVGEEGLARQHHRGRGEGVIRPGLGKRGGDRLDERRRHGGSAAAPPFCRHVEQQPRRVLLPGIPPHEGILVMCRQHAQLIE